MTNDEFREMVRVNGRGYAPDRQLDESTNVFLRRGTSHRDDVLPCIELAKGLAEAGRWQTPLFPATPELSMATDQILEAIHPGVVQLRWTIFRKQTAPFRSAKAAQQWVQRTASRGPKRFSAEDRQARIELDRKWIETHDVFDDEPMSIKWRVPSLSFVSHGAQGRAVHFSRKSKLYKLESMSHWVAEATGGRLSKVDVALYVLAGIKPRIPPVRFRVDHGNITALSQLGNRGLIGPEGPIKLRMPKTIIEIYSRDFTLNELRKLYHRVRSNSGVGRMRPLTTRDRDIIGQVRKLGGIPSKGDSKRGNIQDFWEKVRSESEWGKKHPGKPRPSWRAFEMAHKRALRKLASLNSGSGTL